MLYSSVAFVVVEIDHPFAVFDGRSLTWGAWPLP